MLFLAVYTGHMANNATHEYIVEEFYKHVHESLTSVFIIIKNLRAAKIAFRR